MNSLKKLFFTIIFFLLSLISIVFFYGLILLKDFNKSTDLSLYPVKNTNRKYSKEKIWLISYASNGVYIQNQNNLNMSASMTQAFDVIISYQPHHIDPEYYEKHKEILSQSRGVGYWLWKPYIILKTLEMMPENDILFYVDRSAVFTDKIYALLEHAKKHDITLFPGFTNNRRYMKKAIIDKMMNGNESILNKTQLEAGFLLLRNTAKTRQFIKEWQFYCEDPELLTDSPSKTGEYPDFIDHRHDQAILSALYYNSPEQYNLFGSYAERKAAVFVTRRNDDQLSTSAVTFNKKLGNFNWDNANKYLLNFKKWLIGTQAQAEVDCSFLDEANIASRPNCVNKNIY